MASKAIRRRPTDKGCEKQMETTMPDSVTEPLLGNSAQGSKSEGYKPTTQPDFWDGKSHECLHWAHIVSNFITQSAQKIVNVISQFGSLLARLFGYSCAPQNSQNGQTMLVNLSPLQEERLKFLRQRLNVPFDGSTVQHQDALKELWRLAYPNRQLPPLKSDLWKEMGWQNSDPATDFRAGGFMSLENLIYFARNYPDSFHRLLRKADGERAEWEYPFAVAGVNISFTLAKMLDLQSGEVYASVFSIHLNLLLLGCLCSVFLSGNPWGNYSVLVHFFAGNRSSKASICFVQLLEDDEMAFDNLFCVAFQMLDAQWLARRASYMEFNEVLKSTVVQLEQELTIEGISRVRDMPSFRLLKR